MRTLFGVLAMGLSSVAGCPQPDGGAGNGGVVELGVEVRIANEGAAHAPTGTQLNYRANPPASGTHWPNIAARGFYETAVEPEQWVHNLEHGYVVVLYDCDGPCPRELLDDLREFADSLPASEQYGYAKIVVTPYEGLPASAAITAAAWNVQFHLGGFEREALLDFYNRHLDQGPEDAP